MFFFHTSHAVANWLLYQWDWYNSDFCTSTIVNQPDSLLYRERYIRIYSPNKLKTVQQTHPETYLQQKKIQSNKIYWTVVKDSRTMYWNENDMNKGHVTVRQNCSYTQLTYLSHKRNQFAKWIMIMIIIKVTSITIATIIMNSV